MIPMPPCDHDECPPTQCLKTAATERSDAAGENSCPSTGYAPGEDVVRTIKQRALEYACDNYKLPSQRQILDIENAMLIGASIAEEKAHTVVFSDAANVEKPL